MRRAEVEDGMLSGGADLACSVKEFFSSCHFMIREKLRSAGHLINLIVCAFSPWAINIAHLRITGLQVAAIL
jgi:hypothetical protein